MGVKLLFFLAPDAKNPQRRNSLVFIGIFCCVEQACADTLNRGRTGVSVCASLFQRRFG